MHVFDIFVILTDTDVVTIKNIFKKSAFVTYYMYNVHTILELLYSILKLYNNMKVFTN